MTRRNASLVVVAICAMTAIRVAATHGVFSPTYDEPLHVAAGWQYLAEHRYTKGTDNPPLARAVLAFPLRHARPTATDGPEQIGQVYESAGDYMSGVARSRRGNLLFVVLGIIGVSLLGADQLGRTGGVLAGAIFAMLPPVLAHAGLATTDMAGTAAVALALYTLSRWLGDTSWRWTVLLGLSAGFVLTTKFTFALFLAVAGITMMISRRRLPLARGLVAFCIALAVTYTVYLAGHAAPRFLIGIVNVARISSHGHEAFLLGEIRRTGWWYYFPVALGVKTPLPVLLLAACGVWAAFRHRRNRELLAVIAVMLLAAMSSRANLGIRHVLPLYVPIAIVAAAGLLALGRTTLMKWTAGVLVAWLMATGLFAHPDYLPWMNALAGPHPERVLLDSNLDWGQDLLRLRDACRARGITRLGALLFGTADRVRIGLPPTTTISKDEPSTGWFAVSETEIVSAQARDPKAYAWLTSRAFERIGKSIRLYRVTASRDAAARPPAS